MAFTCECCINHVECFYSTHLTTGARDNSCGKFCPIPRTTSSLSRCVANSIETAIQRHWMPNCQSCSGYSPTLRLQKRQQLLFDSSKIKTAQLTQRLQQTFDCLQRVNQNIFAQGDRSRIASVETPGVGS